MPVGTRRILGILVVAYLAALAGRSFGAWDLYRWCALESPAFWKGDVWRVISYAFLPAGLTDFLVNGILLTVAGCRVEQVWSRRELWSFCLLMALGVGLTKVVVVPAGAAPLLGAAGVVYGLLAAWIRLFGHEEIRLMGVWPMSARWALILFAGLSVALSCWQPGGAGLQNLIPLAGGVIGWLYLGWRWRRNLADAGQTIASKRIRKLEL